MDKSYYNSVYAKCAGYIYDEMLRAGDYVDMEEALEARSKATDLFFEDDRFLDIRQELDNAIGDSELASEKQGFIFGFLKAIEVFDLDFTYKEKAL